MKSHLPLPEANLLTPVLLWEGGPPYTIFYGEEPWDRGVILSLNRAVRNKSVQEQSVSKPHLENVSLSVWLVSSTIPEL